MSFAGKVAVVTGAGSGIGRALAAELVARGARVVSTDIDRDAVRSRRLDVTDAEAVRTLIDEVADEHGRIPRA